MRNTINIRANLQNIRKRQNIPHPFFSVIITTFNRALLLRRAIESLINQTEKDWEAIIIDDGSTDNTYATVLPYLKIFSKIRYVRKIHNGESLSKNRGLWMANGKFITFLDSDDEYEPVHLEIRKKILIQNSGIELLHGGVKIIGNQFVPDRFDNQKKVSLKDCIIGGTFFINRNVAYSLKGFRNILIGTDADFFERAKNSGVHIRKIDDPTYIYHHETEDSITNKMIQKEFTFLNLKFGT